MDITGTGNGGWRMTVKDRKVPSDILTCGEVAELLGIAARTASKIIDRGEIPGWRIGSDKSRRVKYESVDAYAARHGIPIRRHGGVLMVAPTVSADRLKKFLGKRLIHAACLGLAGQLFERCRPAWTVIDLGYCDRHETASWMRLLAAETTCKVAVLLADGEEAGEVQFAASTFTVPCDWKLVAEEMME